MESKRVVSLISISLFLLNFLFLLEITGSAGARLRVRVRISPTDFSRFCLVCRGCGPGADDKPG